MFIILQVLNSKVGSKKIRVTEATGLKGEFLGEKGMWKAALKNIFFALGGKIGFLKSSVSTRTPKWINNLGPGNQSTTVIYFCWILTSRKVKSSRSIYSAADQGYHCERGRTPFTVTIANSSRLLSKSMYRIQKLRLMAFIIPINFP